MKPHRVEADWVKGGGQKDDWTGVRMSVLRLNVCESGRTDQLLNITLLIEPTPPGFSPGAITILNSQTHSSALRPPSTSS